MQQIDLVHPIWKMLPLHPQPNQRESLSGYIVRLAEANGLKSVNELARLSGLRKGWSDPDYSSHLTGRLSWIAGCPPDHLQNMTIYHLARHFACPTFSFAEMAPFFQGSLAASLRYCPACLAEHPYYRLSFRFLALAGCALHGCSFLDTCGHCETPLPFLPRRPRIACCMICRGDLRTCQMSPLSQQGRASLERRTYDLERLLTPAELAPEITAALLQGSGFFFLRLRRRMGLAEAAYLLGKNEQVVRAIEEGNWGKRATLTDYWRYTEILDCSLSDVIEAAQTIRGNEDERKLKRRIELIQLVEAVETEDLRHARSENPW